MLVPSIGTGPVHGPMVLDAADSTVRLMLSLNVNVSRQRQRLSLVEAQVPTRAGLARS